MMSLAPAGPCRLFLALALLSGEGSHAQEPDLDLEEIGRRIREAVEARAARQERRKSDVAGTEERTVSHLDVDRHYYLHLPGGKTPEAPLPLVIALHGAFTDGPIMEELTQFSVLADRENFAVVYPEANPDGGIGLWEFWAPPIADPGKGASGERRMTQGRDDVGFVGAMIDALVEEGVADPRRVFATGISNGAFMANRVSLDLGDRIGAVGAVAGTALKFGALFTRPKRPMPVIYFHGTDDEIVGIDGTDAFSKGRHSQSSDEFAAWWAGVNGCGKEPVSESPPDLQTGDNSTVDRLTWEAGDAKAPVIFYRIHGGGHTWAGGTEHQPEDVLGNVCRDIDASALMWDFFQEHPLPASAPTGLK